MSESSCTFKFCTSRLLKDTVLNKLGLIMYFPPADFFFVHSQNSGIDPSGGLSHASPISIYYYTARGYFISLTNNPCQSCGRYDPTRHFIALSSNSKFQHGAALLLPTTWMARLEHWQLNILSLCLVSCPYYVPNASSTFYILWQLGQRHLCWYHWD